jgi:electron transfer flavoprotein alpha subunit
MNYIVLVKQVPDIRNIPNEAWDWEKGILKRSLLDNVCNELDKQALAFAVSLNKARPGKIISLTMGPPFAEDVLRYAMSVGADAGVLLTDRKLGGADTAATAYPLARAIRKIEKDLFGGDKEYLVISGMQSVDGDTAQVPPQIAEEMGIPHIAYATAFKDEFGQVRFDRITRLGKESLIPLTFPCMVTVTQWTEPLSASFARTRWAMKEKLITLSAADIQCEDSLIGLAGSRTTVFRIFSPKEVSKRNCVYETEYDRLAGALKEAYKTRSESAEVADEAPKYHLPDGKKPSYTGEVWIFAEQEGGEINPASFELLGKASDLAGQLGVKVGAVLAGSELGEMPKQLIAHGADKVYVADDPLLRQFLPVPYAKAVGGMVEAYKPQMMLFSATPQGRELGPRVAYRTKSGLTADCTGLDIVDFKRGSTEYTAILRQTRPALGGNIMASIITQNSACQMSTARPGVMKALKPDSKRTGEVIKFNAGIKDSDAGTLIVSSEAKPLASEIKDATILVCGGAGCKSKENYDRYIRQLADAIGKYLGQPAMVAASRAGVELGFIDRSHQVGQTGQTVKPKVYVAIGVSGAVQHLTGMQNSDIILAINKDPNARIFKVCDFGVVGNLEEVVPELIKALDSQGGQRA